MSPLWSSVALAREIVLALGLALEVVLALDL